MNISWGLPQNYFRDDRWSQNWCSDTKIPLFLDLNAPPFANRTEVSSIGHIIAFSVVNYQGFSKYRCIFLSKSLKDPFYFRWSVYWLHWRPVEHSNQEKVGFWCPNTNFGSTGRHENNFVGNLEIWSSPTSNSKGLSKSETLPSGCCVAHGRSKFLIIF